MSVYFQNDERQILVRGKTYPYRDLMRALGGEYQAGEKTWAIPLNPESLERITELCRSVGGGRSKDAPPLAASPEPSLETPAAEGTREPLLDGLSISELMQKAQLVIAQGFPRSVWVLGEIQNFRHHASGIYFQLADFKDGASRSATLTISATLWRSQFAELERKHGAPLVRELLQDGLRVRLLVDVTLYKDRAQLSLQVQGLDPSFTKGSLALAREKLLRELRSKGIDRQNKALPLPRFPLHIGLISAPESRAQSDFIDQLRVYRFPGTVTFFASPMQGEKTLQEVVRGIQTLAGSGCDLIVITRGGGSAADLRWFDSPEIAYAIAACPVPIVAAIGHHEDVCIAEEICAQREKTPTAAADFVISLLQRTRDLIDQLGLSISRQLDERMRIQSSQLASLRDRLLMQLQRVLAGYTQQQAQLSEALDLQLQRRSLRAEAQLQRLQQELLQRASLRLQAQASRQQQALATLRHQTEARLARAQQVIPRLLQAIRSNALQSCHLAERHLHELEKPLVQRDPQPWMQQGWTQLQGPEGRLASVRQLRSGTSLTARLPDGRVELIVQSIQPATKESP